LTFGALQIRLFTYLLTRAVEQDDGLLMTISCD